jgi:heme/copper-type cytochrome/quinol oxidase subunit 2
MIRFVRNALVALAILVLFSCSSGDGLDDSLISSNNTYLEETDEGGETQENLSMTTTEPPVESTEPPVELTEPPVESTEPPVEPTEPPAEEPLGVTVEIESGTVVGGIQRLKAKIGDQIRITVSSDVEDEFHLHAYDLTLQIAPNEPATLIFEADIPGVFEGELHDAGYQILSLEVS